MVKKIIALVIATVLVLSMATVCHASDYSAYTQEEIQAEIERLESELAVLYSLLEEPEPETVEADPGKVLTYTGTGDTVVNIEEYGDWFMFEIEGNYGANYFGVIAYDENGERLGSLVNTTDVYHGRVYDKTQSARMLEVKATGDWSIKVMSLYAADYGLKGDTVNGSGDNVVLFFTDNGESLTASIKGNSGADYFGIIGYDGHGSRTGALVNTTDVYSGTVLLKNSPRIFEIKATGDWEITFE